MEGLSLNSTGGPTISLKSESFYRFWITKAILAMGKSKM